MKPQTTLDTFHFPETVQMFSNPTPNTKSSISPTKTSHHWLNTYSMCSKGHLNYKTITSQNVSYDTQVKNCFIS